MPPDGVASTFIGNSLWAEKNADLVPSNCNFGTSLPVSSQLDRDVLCVDSDERKSRDRIRPRRRGDPEEEAEIQFRGGGLQGAAARHCQ